MYILARTRRTRVHGCARESNLYSYRDARNIRARGETMQTFVYLRHALIYRTRDKSLFYNAHGDISRLVVARNRVQHVA